MGRVGRRNLNRGTVAQLCLKRVKRGHGVGRMVGWELNGEHCAGTSSVSDFDGEILVSKEFWKKLNGDLNVETFCFGTWM